MAIKSEKIEGESILNEYTSSNLISSEYNVPNKTLQMKFKGGRTYKYDSVPMNIFTKMRLAESQGKYFNKEISRKYRYTEVKK